MLTFEDVLARFDGVQRVGNTQANARCPVHDDRHASLSIGLVNGRVRLHCHAGCGFGPILLAANPPIDWRELGPDTQVGTVKIAPSARLPRPVADQPTGRAQFRNVMPGPGVLEHWQSQIGEVVDRLGESKGWSPDTIAWARLGWDGDRVVVPVCEADRLVAMVRYLPDGPSTSRNR